ncbi:hypothetical protein B0F90DRAFT_1144802 [Multifurca ochricompacta]|uniref:Uncharacterized protein n=1 Tax=Multifurca ochricompacta TaxID=376703 RepID=A0AAD4LZH5_9AGAM|nr:hypothetical protein B0F90DRAFT_1144802 [Multifurca ochricompacta]
MAISTTGQCDILPVSGLSGPKITPSTDDSPPLLPYLHYMSERDRVHRYSATKRTTMLASLPGRCPYRARSSLKNSNKLELGWLEFHSPDPPDPEVARPGDVWIQVPLDFDPPTTTTADPSLCRLFVCYSQEGRLWTEWEGDERIHSNDPPVGMHPFASPALWGGTTKRDEQFYLAFTGSEFTWVTGTRLAGITTQWRHGKFSGLWMRRLATKHTEGAIPFLTPAEAIAAWAERKTLTASGVQRKGERKRVSTEPTHDLPSAKRPRPTTDFSAETSSLPVSQGWHPMSAPLPSSLESRNAPYHYRFIPWPHLSYWAVVPPIPAPSSTPPSSDASNGPVGITNAPPSPTFVLRPATFACSSPPVDETQPSGEPSHPHSRPPPPPPLPLPRHLSYNPNHQLQKAAYPLKSIPLFDLRRRSPHDHAASRTAS